MSNTTLIYVGSGAAGVLSLIAWTAWVLIPAVTSYARLWERVLAGLLSVYVLLAFLLAGTGLGAAVLWFYDEV